MRDKQERENICLGVEGEFGWVLQETQEETIDTLGCILQTVLPSMENGRFWHPASHLLHYLGFT